MKVLKVMEKISGESDPDHTFCEWHKIKETLWKLDKNKTENGGTADSKSWETSALCINKNDSKKGFMIYITSSKNGSV